MEAVALNAIVYPVEHSTAVRAFASLIYPSQFQPPSLLHDIRHRSLAYLYAGVVHSVSTRVTFSAATSLSQRAIDALAQPLRGSFFRQSLLETLLTATANVVTLPFRIAQLRAILSTPPPTDLDAWVNVWRDRIFLRSLPTALVISAASVLFRRAFVMAVAAVRTPPPPEADREEQLRHAREVQLMGEGLAVVPTILVEIAMDVVLIALITNNSKSFRDAVQGAVLPRLILKIASKRFVYDSIGSSTKYPPPPPHLIF
jgi:hypothetical protein